MDAITALREDLGWAFQLLHDTVSDVTSEQAHWQPPGLANPLGALYVHAICGMDAVVQVLLKGRDPLFSREWAGKTGVEDPRWELEFQWARSLKVDLAAVHVYAQEVYRQADEHLASMRSADLDHRIDLSARGFGKRTLAWIWIALVISHLNNMTGEISCLKGLQGARGYPY